MKSTLINHKQVRSAIASVMDGSPERLDSAELDKATAKYLAHQAVRFGTHRMDAETLDFVANFLADEVESGRRLDAGETMIVAAAGMLESRLAPQTILRPPVKARQLMTVTREVDRGARTWSYEMYDSTGMAELIENYSDDLSSVSVNSTLVSGDVLAFGKSYEWTWEDMNAAAKTGVQLKNAKAAAVVEAFERRVDRVGALGHDGTNVTGLLNNANITVLQAATAAAGAHARPWDGADKTNNEILTDLVTAWKRVVSDSKGLHRPDRCVLPLSHVLMVKTKTTSTEGAPTVWDEFRRIVGVDVQLTDWHFAATADSGGTGERMVMWDSAYAAELEIPVEPEDLPPQAKSLAVVVNTLAKVAGARVRYPLAFVYMDDI